MENSTIIKLAHSLIKSQLHKAAEDGNLVLLSSLIDGGKFSVNYVDSGKNTALHRAAKMGRNNVVEYLISKGATIEIGDFQERTPLIRALEQKHYDTVELLLSKGAKIILRNILFQRKSKFSDSVRMLEKAIELGGDVNELDRNNNSLIHLLVLNTSSPNSNFNFEMMKVAATLLIKKGANPNLQNNQYLTPLMLCDDEHFEIIKFLLEEAKADINCTDNNDYSFFYQFIKRYPFQQEMIEYIGKFGTINRNIHDKRGESLIKSLIIFISTIVDTNYQKLYTRVIQILIENCKFDTKYVGSNGENYIQFIISMCNQTTTFETVEIYQHLISFFVSQGISLLSTNNNDENIFHLCNNPDVAEWLYLYYQSDCAKLLRMENTFSQSPIIAILSKKKDLTINESYAQFLIRKTRPLPSNSLEFAAKYERHNLICLLLRNGSTPLYLPRVCHFYYFYLK